jgi:hypothetical protein
MFVATNITITREMATQFINIYHGTANIHMDEFYEGCMMNAPLFSQIRNMTVIDAYPFVQTVYVTIVSLITPAFCLENNIKYCIDYINIDSQSVNYLNKANLNYHVLHKIYSSHYRNISVCYEDLADATLEPNMCSVCQYENNINPAKRQHFKKFYYSSAFSLNTPVCQDCLLFDASDDEDKALKKDPDYKPFAFIRENENETHYLGSCEVGSCEVGSCEVGSCEVGSCEVGSCDDEEIHYENIVLTSTYSAMHYNYDAEPTQADLIRHGEQCYNLGWEGGWEAAMKYVETQVKNNHKAPVVQCCHYCGKEGKTKKCGGTCNGNARYCSVDCQAADWKQVHKYICLNKTSV